MALIIIFTFLAMIMFGGIAVDVMRFETRRVAMQQTLDRAALAAASLEQTRTPKEIAEDWFNKAGVGADLAMVEFSTPEVSTLITTSQRRVSMSARVRSYNFFMGIYSNNDFLEGPTTTEAAEGITEIEVMLVLDITGSMGGTLSDGVTKIQALREAATDFVDIVKSNDTRNGVSIGIVPYAAQVNIPVELRNQFNAVNISSWDGVANAGVPNINCMEIPTSTYGATGVSLTDPIPMAAVADTINTVSTTTNYLAPVAPNAASRACTTVNDNAGTARNEATANQIVMPTKDGEIIKDRIGGLVAAGNTYIAVGMRWGTALIDQAARPIYTAIGDSTVQGRPVDNSSNDTRKIIVLMTDGSHVTNGHIVDAYKSGPSPIYRGSDGRFAIEYTTDGQARTNGTRPGCAGANTFFVPHLKPNTSTSCNSAAWLVTPTWPLLNGSNQPVLDALGQPVLVDAVRLDWSEVWRYVRVSWVARQLYMRSNVSGTGTYSTIMNTFRQTYLSSTSNMNALLQQNCAAARAAGIEIYGIAFGAPTAGQTQINGCASEPKVTYYYNATNNAALLAAFREIAADIADLRLTQ